MKQNAVTIRAATRDDVSALLPLVRAYRVFYEQQPDGERERAFLERHLQNGTSVVYLAEIDGEAAGFVQLFKTYSTVHLSSAWILEDLFVAQAHRGRGIGRRLLDRAKEHALADGASGMFLETAYENETAQRLYERAGWTREGRFYKYNAPLHRP